MITRARLPGVVVDSRDVSQRPWGRCCFWIAKPSCGAMGGAYDAAIARGHHPREAIDLMVAHGLTSRRAGRPNSALARLRTLPPLPPRPRNDRSAHHEPGAPRSRELAIGEPELAVVRERLAGLVWPPQVLRPEQA